MLLLFLLIHCSSSIVLFLFLVQGMVTILYQPPNDNDEVEIRLLVSLNTQAQEVCDMCLQYLSLNEDSKCFFIVISRKDRKGELPLLLFL